MAWQEELRHLGGRRGNNTAPGLAPRTRLRAVPEPACVVALSGRKNGFVLTAGLSLRIP